MRITKAYREAVIAAVRKDMPETSGAKLNAEIEKDVLNWAVSKLPEKVREIYDDKRLRPFLRFESHRLTLDKEGAEKFTLWINAPMIDRNSHHRGIESVMAKSDLDRLQKKVTAFFEVKAKVDDAIGTLEAMLAGCSSYKALKAILPAELLKYAPEPDSEKKNLPATRQVINSLTAAGWPA